MDGSKILANPKAEKVVLLAFQHPEMTQQQIGEAAGFSKRTAYAQVSRLLKRPEVKARLAWLQAQAVSDAILSVTSRKEILTQIAKGVVNADLADFIREGDEGPRLSRDMAGLKRMAIDWSRSKWRPDGDDLVFSDLKLVDPMVAIQAIDLLNKMDGSYSRQSSCSGPMVQLIVQTPDGSRTELTSGR